MSEKLRTTFNCLSETFHEIGVLHKDTIEMEMGENGVLLKNERGYMLVSPKSQEGSIDFDRPLKVQDWPKSNALVFLDIKCFNDDSLPRVVKHFSEGAGRLGISQAEFLGRLQTHLNMEAEKREIEKAVAKVTTKLAL